MRIIIYIYISLFLLGCEEEYKNFKSINDYNSSQITGTEAPVKITISKKDEILYKVECDSLVNFEENILLFNNVDIEIFNNNIKSTNLFSDKAVIKGQIENGGKKINYNFSKSNMVAEGNVVIQSLERDDQLFTNKIMLYNNNRCNILIDTTESVTLVNNNDTIRGFGFESDCDLKNWEILKPVGIINKN